MTDIAEIGFSVNTAELVRGENALTKLGLAGGKAQGASQRVARATDALAASFGDTRGKADQVASAIGQLSPIAQRINSQFQGLSDATNNAASSAQVFEVRIEDLSRAYSLGIISARKYKSSLKLLKESFAKIPGPIKTTTGGTTKFGNETKIAGGHVGNLTAQLNDIGVMMAAGQSPFQLAIQQGTQITQVFSQLGGGAKALRGLGAAVLSAVSPFNLLTLGVIAGGAALGQWLIGLIGKTQSVSDHMETMTESMDDYQNAMKRASMSTSDMINEYGRVSPILQQIHKDMAALAKIDAEKDINSAISGFIDNIDTSYLGILTEYVTGSKGIAKSIESWFTNYAGTDTQNALKKNIYILDESKDLAEKIRAATDMKGILLDNVGSIEELNETDRKRYHNLSKIIEAYETMIALWDKEAELAKQKAATDRQSVMQMIEKYEKQIALNAIIEKHGNNSLEASRLRVAHGRDELTVKLKLKDVSEDVRQSALATYDKLHGYATALSFAAKEARGLLLSLQQVELQSGRNIAVLEARIAAVQSGGDVQYAADQANLNIEKQKYAQELRGKGLNLHEFRQNVERMFAGRTKEIELQKKLRDLSKPNDNSNDNSNGGARTSVSKPSALQNLQSEVYQRRRLLRLGYMSESRTKATQKIEKALAKDREKWSEQRKQQFINQQVKLDQEFATTALRSQIIGDFTSGNIMLGAQKFWTNFKGLGVQAWSDLVGKHFNEGGSGLFGLWGDVKKSWSNTVSSLSSIGASFGSIASGIGGALSAVLPVAGLALSAINLIKGFSSKQLIGAGVGGTLGGDNASAYTYEKIKRSSFWGLISNTSEKQNKHDTLTAQLGLAGGQIMSGVKDMIAPLGGFAGDLSDIQHGFRFDTRGKKDDEIKSMLDHELQSYGDKLSEHALGTDEFTRLGETASDTLKRLTTSLTASNDAFGKLGYTLFEASKIGANAASSFVDLFHGVSNFKSSTSSYWKNFYTDHERLEYATDSLAASLQDLGINAIPHTRSAFRSLIDDAMVDGNQKLAASLIQLSPELVDIQQQQKGLVDASKRLANANAFQTLADKMFAETAKFKPIILTRSSDSASDPELNKLMRQLIEEQHTGFINLSRHAATTAAVSKRMELKESSEQK